MTSRPPAGPVRPGRTVPFALKCRRAAADQIGMEAATFAGVLGAIVGSFLNVVAYRLPRHESLVTPASHCPGCGTPVKPYDNVPILSWLLLRGPLPQLRDADLGALPAGRGAHGRPLRGRRARARLGGARSRSASP